MTVPATIFLVDDDEAVLRGVGRLLRAHGFAVTSFDSARVFLERHDASAPGCVLLDFGMPDINGLEVQRRLEASGCRRPVVFLTGQADIPISVEAMKRGAVDFLTKPVDEAALVRAAHAGLERDRVWRERAGALADRRRRYGRLSPREREVMALVVQGLLNKQVAAELGTAEKTVKVHRGRVMEKMGASSLADLVRIAGSLGVGPEAGPGPGGDAAAGEHWTKVP